MIRSNLLSDAQGRVMRDLRVSITDRCNFRCLYCLPETEEAANFFRSRAGRAAPPAPISRQWQPASAILSYEEIERTVRVAANLGIEKIRLTGGEPLLRRNIEFLVERLAGIPGIKDLALTSNGFLFRQKAGALKSAGLRRISFSMDSLDRVNFKKITGRDGLEEVLASIELARQLGFDPVKVNAVIIRGLNDHEVVPLAEFAQKHDLCFRFIEFMPLDSNRAWQKDLVVSGKEILERLQTCFQLEPIPPRNPAETAKRFAFADGRGEIGIIASVTDPFCGHCNRIRLTADGKLRTCLFSVIEHDLRRQLRDPQVTDAGIEEYLRSVVWQKEPGHRIGQSGFTPPERSMSCIGG